MKRHALYPICSWTVMLGLLWTSGVSCGSHWKQTPHDRWFQRAPGPILHQDSGMSYFPSGWWDRFQYSTVVPLAKSVSPARYVDGITGGRPALDTNRLGQVPDSTWFENRMGKRDFHPREIRQGPNRLGGPARGILTVLADKSEGVSPGLVVQDRRGVIWFAKFDPPAFSELATGAEWIASRLLFAAGYHIPETYLVDLALERLRIADNATRKNKYNQRVQMKKQDLKQLIALLNPGPQGQLRAVFSRAVPGRAMGPFSFRGLRPDDPNDHIPHQRRRSLRGLWVFSAWLNNTDAWSQNTMDTFIAVPRDPYGRGFIRHYLIDFGDALGAAGNRSKNTAEGHVYRIDWTEIAKSIVLLGGYYPYWHGVRRTPFRSVGVFESEKFRPGLWRSTFPNPAFVEATPQDTFWAASILARFQYEHVRAAVSSARYTELGAMDWVIQVLMERRDKLLRYAFDRMLPVSSFQAQGLRVLFVDLEYQSGLRPTPARYSWQLRWNRTRRSDVEIARGETGEQEIDLRRSCRACFRNMRDEFWQDPFVTLTVSRRQQRARVEVHFRVATKGLIPIGLKREFR